MGRWLLLFGVLLAASASAQPASRPASPSPVRAILDRAENLIEAVLATEKPLEKLVQDEAIFTPRFLGSPTRRGDWKLLADAGGPREPAVFDVSCKTTGGVGASFADIFSGKPENICRLPMTCEAGTTRANGCYTVRFDVCASANGAPQIDRLSGGTRALGSDVNASVTLRSGVALKRMTPCESEAAKRARNAGR